MARPPATHNNNLDNLLSQLDDSVNEFLDQQDDDETYEDVLGGYATLRKSYMQQQQQQKQISSNSRTADDLLDMYNDDAEPETADNVSETVSSVAPTSPNRVEDYASSFAGSRGSRRDSIKDDTSSVVEQLSPISMNRSISYGAPRKASVDSKFQRQIMDESKNIQPLEHLRRRKDLPQVPVSVGTNYTDNTQLDPRRRGSSSQQSVGSQRTSSMSASSRRRDPGVPAIPQTYGTNGTEMHALRGQIDAAKQAAADQARSNRDILTQQTLQNLVPIVKQQYPSQRPPPVLLPQQQDSWNSLMQPHMFGGQRSPSGHSGSSPRQASATSPTNENRMSGGRMVSRSKSAHSLSYARGKELKPALKKKDLSKGLMDSGLL
ncbi:hypothetical protein HDU81_005527 [Chytriomyces hyalinus]|nr:hypothetical protein HDU81_005527 [Chytriomyces hyalinus]